MSAFKLYACLSIIVTLVACGPQQKADDVVSTSSAPTAFEGAWQIACQPDPNPNRLPPGEFVETFYVFEGHTLRKIQRNYTAPREGEQPCAAGTLAYMHQQISPFELKKVISNLVEEVPVWSNGDYGHIEVQGTANRVIPLSVAAAVSWNSYELCGEDNWRIGVAISMNGRLCLGIRLFTSIQQKLAVKYETGATGAFITFGTFNESGAPLYDETLKFKRLTSLPFALK